MLLTLTVTTAYLAVTQESPSEPDTRLTAALQSPPPPPTPEPAVAPVEPTAAPETPPPPPPTSPQVRPVAASSLVEVGRRIAAAWPGDDEWALSTTWCESHWQPGVVGAQFGLWQFVPSTWRRNGGHGMPQHQSIEAQTAVAWTTYQREGASSWVCSGRGRNHPSI